MCNLRHRLFSHLMDQEIGFFDRIRTGELMNRLSEVPARLAVKCIHMFVGLEMPPTIPCLHFTVPMLYDIAQKQQPVHMAELACMT